MTEAERAAALEAIAAEVAVCTRCRLHEGRSRPVPGEGSADTEVVFIGEGPGFNEDRQGRPFVGRAGKVLVDLLGSVGWRREEVFITNVVKCRPPDNRDPEPDEIAACAPYLSRQLAALDPALIVTLGRHSMGRFMPGARISQVHGTYRAADPSVGAPDALVFAMYHPAAADRSSEVLRQSQADMRAVPLALLEARRLRDAHEAARESPSFAATPEVAVGADPIVTPEVSAAPEVPVVPEFSVVSEVPAALEVPVAPDPIVSADPILPPELPDASWTPRAAAGTDAAAQGDVVSTANPTPPVRSNGDSDAVPTPIPEPAVPVPSATSAPAELEPVTGQLTLF